MKSVVPFVSYFKLLQFGDKMFNDLMINSMTLCCLDFSFGIEIRTTINEQCNAFDQFIHQLNATLDSSQCTLSHHRIMN